MEKPRKLADFGSEEMKKFLDSFDIVITDCDGVLWIGPEAIEGSIDTLKKLKSMGKKVVYVSNNGATTMDQYYKKFSKLGLPTSGDDIVIPANVICWYIKNRGFDGSAFVIGTKSFVQTLRNGGIDVVEPSAPPLKETHAAIIEEAEKSPNVGAVIIDVDVNFNWSKLVRSIRYLKNREVLFLVGAIDRKIMISEKLTLSGNSQFIELITNETDRQPTKCGKPSEIMKNYVMDKWNIIDPSRCIFIGDSLENDMKFADLCGFGKLWVGSGIDTPDSTIMTVDSSIPDYYLPRLGALMPHLEAFSRLESP